MLATGAAHAQGARLVRPGQGADSAAAEMPPMEEMELRRNAEERAFAERERARLARRGQRPGRAPAGPVPEAPSALPADPGFEVLVRTDAPEYVVWADEAEPMQIQVVSSRDGYLTLLSGGLGPDLTILAPSDLLAQLPIRADEPLLFPLREWFVQGIELRPTLPGDAASSPQSIIAVVTREPIALPLFDWTRPERPGVDDRLSLRLFQAWLARIPPGERGVAQAFYLVTRGS